MSLGYAEKLSYKEDVGPCGMAEVLDPPALLDAKVEELASLIQNSRSVVIFTGAGISTSCGIPDFRGPAGVWTLQKAGKPIPAADTPFAAARPGASHMAIVALLRAGIARFVVSQNVDGLHLRSGVPRRQLAELHGNCFRENCPACGAEYVRDFELGTVGLKPTGRRCTRGTCRKGLRDSVLDWEHALPEGELTAAREHCAQADLVLCLGTSLIVTPACNLPLRTVRAGGRMVIVNKQITPKDKRAALVIHASVDAVMSRVLTRLGLALPPFVRTDSIVIRHQLNQNTHPEAHRSRRQPSPIQAPQRCRAPKRKAPAANEGHSEPFKAKVYIESRHGSSCPLPLVTSVEACFLSDGLAQSSRVARKPPVRLQRIIRSNEEGAHCEVSVRVHFGEGSMTPCAHIVHTLQQPDKVGVSSVEGSKSEIEEALRAKAAETRSCGEVTAISTKRLNTTEVATEYAVVTVVQDFNVDCKEA